MKNFIYTLFVIFLYLATTHANAQYTFDDAVLTAEEGQTALVFVTFTPGGAVAGPITVEVDYPKSSASGMDFSFILGNQLNFAGGAPVRQMVAVKITKDDLVEDQESITLQINAGGVILASRCIINISSSTKAPNPLDSLYAAFGGNLNLRDKKVVINSVYADITYDLRAKFSESGKDGLYIPLRLFFNNGSGPVQTENANPQRFFTIDTTFIENNVKKVKFWDDRPYINYKSETSNFGLNVPILFIRKWEHNPNMSWGGGYNFDFAIITIKRFDFVYTDFVTIPKVVNSLKEVPIPAPDTIRNPDNSINVIRSNRPFYGTAPFRPTLTIPNTSATYVQTQHGVSIFIAYDSPRFFAMAKYVVGGTVNYYNLRDSAPLNNYKHTIQFQVWERKFGVKVFIDARLPQVKKNIANGFPNLYVSISKTINFGALMKAVF